jgi:hypothetical protein
MFADIEDAMVAVSNGTANNISVPTDGEKQAESWRVMAFALRKKREKSGFKDDIGITKIRKGKKVFVKIYKIENKSRVWYTENSDGELVELKRRLIPAGVQWNFDRMKVYKRDPKEIREAVIAWAKEEFDDFPTDEEFIRLHGVVKGTEEGKVEENNANDSPASIAEDLTDFPEEDEIGIEIVKKDAERRKAEKAEMRRLAMEIEEEKGGN